MIKRHDCKRKDSLGYKYQTERYGEGYTVCNIMKGNKRVRCTICGEVIDL